MGKKRPSRSAQGSRAKRRPKPGSPEFERIIEARLKKFASDNPQCKPATVEAQRARFRWDVALAHKRGTPTFDLMNSILWESDRGCVLVAAAIADNQLEEMLRTFFAKHSDATTDDMDFFLSKRPQPVLQSCALKIRLAYLLGMIDAPLRDSLLELQSLRSTVAAHSRVIMEIKKEHLTAIFAPLTDSSRRAILELMEASGKDFAAMPIGEMGPLKISFAYLAMYVFMLLEQAHARIKKQRKKRHTSGSSRSRKSLAKT